MARIKTDRVLNYSDPKSQHSYCATPEMGVIKHFPKRICEALIEMGAEDVTQRPVKPSLA